MNKPANVSSNSASPGASKPNRVLIWGPLFISLVSLAVSGATFVTNREAKQSELRKAKHDQFRTNLIDMEGMMNWQDEGNMVHPLLQVPASQINIFYLDFDAAQRLEAELRDDLNFAEYLVLARTSKFVTGRRSTEQYMQKALAKLEKASPSQSRASAYLQLAELAYSQTPADLTKAREYMHRAIDETDQSPNIDLQSSFISNLYLSWAVFEHETGDPKIAESYEKKAYQSHPLAAMEVTKEHIQKQISLARERRSAFDGNPIEPDVSNGKRAGKKPATQSLVAFRFPLTKSGSID